MSPPIDPLLKITPERETWRVKVRVIRLWYLPSFNNPRALNSIEMVFMDEFGCKIHASVRKTLVYKFKPLLSEGQVYILAYFGVGENSGFFRTTKHEFRLNFQIRTTVRPSQSEIIPLHGLSLIPFEEILQPDGEPAYLVDVIGLLTAVGTEREYDKDGKKTKMIVIELDAESIKIECALFGSYVDELTSFIASGDMSQPVLVIQFAKIKTFKGKNVLQNVMFGTRILFNPDIPEVSDFKKNMDSSTPTSSRRRGPVITEIVLDLNKAYGEVPASFSSIYGNQIGPVVSITDPRGNNFSVGFTKRQAYGKLTKGWSDLLSFYSLSDNDIISLRYIGDIYFRMSIMDNNRQEIQYPHPMGDNPQVESDNSSDSEPPPIDCNITLSKYMVSGSQLNLPAHFAKHCINKSLDSVYLVVGDAMMTCKLNISSRRSNEMSLGKGWKNFCRMNDLREGDEINFAINGEDDNVLETTIFRGLASSNQECKGQQAKDQ